MPVIVPALRLCYVFLNVFETFKTLRPPPPSSRNGRQISMRAMSQRKRAMKGCMAIWIVWCCFAMYERSVDGVVRIFVPFYDEIKSLVLLFFLLTRARGAEPIYLHCLRPLIKPHVSKLDTCLEFATSLGDLILLLSALPIDFVRDVYRQWVPSSSNNSPGESRNSTPGTVPLAKPSDNGSAQPVIGYIAGNPSYPLSSGPRDSPNPSSYQIWYPPPPSDDAPSYDAPILNPLSGLPTPPTDNPPPYVSAVAPAPVLLDDWYPPFPAAYPPTPLPASSKLDREIVAPVPMRSASGVPFSGIPEEPMDCDDPAAPYNGARTNPTNQQGFQRSLQSPRELSNPNSDGGLSDDDDMHGIETDHDDDAMSVDDDSEDFVEEEEDDFEVTLRTPSKLRLRLRPPVTSAPTVLLSSASTDSQASGSTQLSTTDNGSSLRTRTNSEASTTQSDVPSVAGRKRPLLDPDTEVAKKTTMIMEKPRPSRLPLHARRQIPSRRTGTAKDSSAATAEDENKDTGATDSDASDRESVQQKRQKIVDPEGLPRAVPKRTNVARPTASSSSRAVKAGPVTSRTRPSRPSSRAAGGAEIVAAVPPCATSGGKSEARKPSETTTGKRTRGKV